MSLLFIESYYTHHVDETLALAFEINWPRQDFGITKETNIAFIIGEARGENAVHGMIFPRHDEGLRT